MLACAGREARGAQHTKVPLGFDTTAVPTLSTTRLQSRRALRSGCGAPAPAENARAKRAFTDEAAAHRAPSRAAPISPGALQEVRSMEPV